jgi:hypothetical protein
MSALLRQGAKLSLAKAGVLDALQALSVDLPSERNECRAGHPIAASAR